MAINLRFDPSHFEALVKDFGIRQAWINILATHIRARGEAFSYILEDKAFRRSKILSEDLLESLTIGEIGVLYEYCVTHVDAFSRKDNGQFFTPDDVALLMVKQANRFPKGRWLDPCSGIGNLSWHLINSQKDKEQFLIKQMVLSDKDDLALFIARVLLTLTFQHNHSNLFNEIEDSFVPFDFLSVPSQGAGESKGNPSLDAIPKHDYVIVNPPYLSMRGSDSRFETAHARDLYAYFLENIIKTSKGFVAVTPQSFTNARKFRELRRLLLNKYSMLRIYAFDNIPGNIFYGVKYGSSNSNSAISIRAAITVAGSGSGGHQITSLLRWRTSERREMFASVDKFLAPGFLNVDYFPKVSAIFHELYEELLDRPTLDSILSSRPTSYVLYVPASPRYFISALKNLVSRASIKTLYFHSSKDMNRAYLLLNSSLMYWWWRVRDGGMTLSLETIRSLPIPEFDIDRKLVGILERSEESNKVYKLNAGALQENVKHDFELLRQINDLVAPRYSDRLILTHQNSELVQFQH